MHPFPRLGLAPDEPGGVTGAMRAVRLFSSCERPVSDPSPERIALAVEAAGRPPFPVAACEDDLGRVLRVEGGAGGLLIDGRGFESGRVRWWAVGRDPNPAALEPFELRGRTRRVHPAERLDADEAQALFLSFLDEPKPPETAMLRPLDGEDGPMPVLAGLGEEPRPVGGWAEVGRFLDRLRGPAAFALSRPGRSLVGILGDGDRFVVAVDELCGSTVRRLEVQSVEGSPHPVVFGSGGMKTRGDRLLDRASLAAVLESLYRYDWPAPGFGWAEPAR